MKRNAMRAARQSGVALIFALIALVALTVGAVALIRSVDSGVMALGNLSFKQTGVSASARGSEAAIKWLEANIANSKLNEDWVDKAYYATDQATLDVTGRTAGSTKVRAMVDWDDNTCKVNGVDVEPDACNAKPSAKIDVGGDEVRYIIMRLCSKTGAFTDGANSCARPIVNASTAAAGKGGINYSNPDPTGSPRISPYFRIVTRTKGPKGTLSYTETLVHF